MISHILFSSFTDDFSSHEERFKGKQKKYMNLTPKLIIKITKQLKKS